MTLAVAARWPWGYWASVFDAAGIRMEDALVVATDSRFTLVGNRGYDDEGRKLYPIRPSSAILYAGDVMAAEDTWKSVDKLLRRRSINHDELERILPLYLRGAYDSEKKRRSKQKLEKIGPLHMFFATATANGLCHIAKFSSLEKDFRPKYFRGVEALGTRGDIDLFYKYFHEIEQWNARENRSLSFGDQLASTLMAQVLEAMQRVLEDPTQSGSVGGRLQALAITRRGIQSQEVHRIGAPLAEDGQPTVQQVTTRLSDVRQYRPRVRYPARASSDFGIVSAHISD
jgi:hypothetical protein